MLASEEASHRVGHVTSLMSLPHHRVAVKPRLARKLKPMNRIKIENRHQIAGISLGLSVNVHARIGPSNACMSVKRHAP